MSPPATCHTASNSAIREVCRWALIEDFFGHGLSGDTSSREGSPTLFPSSPVSVGQPAQGFALKGGFVGKVSWEARGIQERGNQWGRGQVSGGSQSCWSVGLLGDNFFVLFFFQRERGALKAPPVSLPILTGVFEVGTLNSHARSRGSPELVMGSQNVTAAIQPVLNSS